MSFTLKIALLLTWLNRFTLACKLVQPGLCQWRNYGQQTTVYNTRPSKSWSKKPSIAIEMADGDADYSPQIARNLQEILQSDRFVVECFKQRNLKISQALCLLWHDQTSGDVPGRKTSAPLYGNITAAVLVDLFVLGKFSIQQAQRSCLGIKYKKMVIEVR